MITKIRCRSFKRYKAVRRPSCGCLSCFLKYTFRRGKPARKGAIVQYKNTAGNFPLDPTVTETDVLDAQREAAAVQAQEMHELTAGETIHQ